MTVLRLLERIDKMIFVAIHNDSDAPFLDGFMLLLRNPLTWIPLYAFLLYYAIRRAGMQAWKFIVLSVLCFAITDCLSAAVLKPLFARPRPCHDAELQPFIRGVLDCGGMFSFPSSHASNHFGLAVFWYWSIWIMTGKKWKWLWIWAAMISYAQVFVGKHYPVDVLGGALLGITVGTLLAKFFEYLWNLNWTHGRLRPGV
ncbi:MAG: phosphatase PAP2 family protein [Bacteroidetes bacterium]|nr:phosphatase PAP2 family protein [Bacteroidota bacterium]